MLVSAENLHPDTTSLPDSNRPKLVEPSFITVYHTIVSFTTKQDTAQSSINRVYVSVQLRLFGIAYSCLAGGRGHLASAACAVWG